MKVSVGLNPPSLKRRPQKGHGTQDHKGEDCTMDIQKTSNGCGEQCEKKANGPREDEGSN